MNSKEIIPDTHTAHTLLKREVALAMYVQLGRGPTFTATLDEMLECPEMMVPFAYPAQKLMDKLGTTGITRALQDKMIPKINQYYTFDNWAEVLKLLIVYDTTHMIDLREHVDVEMLNALQFR
jgi:hypothetical protein